MNKMTGHPMIDKHIKMSVPEAIDHLKAAIKIHTGHIGWINPR